MSTRHQIVAYAFDKLGIAALSLRVHDVNAEYAAIARMLEGP